MVGLWVVDLWWLLVMFEFWAWWLLVLWWLLELWWLVAGGG